MLPACHEVSSSALPYPAYHDALLHHRPTYNGTICPWTAISEAVSQNKSLLSLMSGILSQWWSLNDFYLNSTVLKNCVHMILIILYLLKIVLKTRIWSRTVNVTGILNKSVYAALLDIVLLCLGYHNKLT
jgi:hypothetical protein